MTSSTQSSDRRFGGRPPDFFLIGVPRAATTSLYFALRQHPQIFAPDLKEACYTCPELGPQPPRAQPRFFDDVNEYLGLFAGAAPGQVIGEGCVVNVYSSAAPAAIRALNPAALMLVQLRDPVDRMQSIHALRLMAGHSREKSFAAALEAERRQRERRPRPATRLIDLDLLDLATVSHGLARFVDEFGRDRLHVTYYDEYRADPRAVLAGICRFLGVSDTFLPHVEVMVPNRVLRVEPLERRLASPGFIASAKQLVPVMLHPAARGLAKLAFRANRRRSVRPLLAPALRDRLRDELRPELDRLSAIVGRDLVAKWWAADRTSVTGGQPG